MKAWTWDDLKAKNIHVKDGKGKLLVLDKPKRRIKTSSVGKDFIEFVLKSLAIPYMKEFRFDTERRFKFDFAVESLKVAVEYEGLVFDSNKASGTGKSGHVTVKGYSSNCTKYNLATLQGWKVLRYTAMNYKEFATDLEKLLK